MKKVLMILAAVAITSTSAAQSVATITDLRLKKTGTAASVYSFRHQGNGIMRSYNAAGTETGSWDAETGTFTGTVGDGSLSNNVALLDAPGQTFTGNLSIDGSLTAGTLFGNGNGLTNLSGAAVSGVSNITGTNTDQFNVNADASTAVSTIGFYDGTYALQHEAGPGYSQFTFNGDVAAPTFFGAFSGSGISITNLNASNLGSGTVPDARFPATLPAVSGANLTALNASNLGSGTVPDARLSANTVHYNDAAPLTFAGNTILLNSGYVTPTAGIIARDYNFDEASFLWDGDEGQWTTNRPLEAAGFTGSGLGLTGVAKIASTNTFTQNQTISKALAGTDQQLLQLTSTATGGDINRRMLQLTGSSRWLGLGINTYSESYIGASHNLALGGGGTGARVLTLSGTGAAVAGTLSATGASTLANITANAAGITNHVFQQGGVERFRVNADGVKVTGRTETGGVVFPYKGIGTNYTVLPTDFMIHVNAGAGSFTITMPQGMPTGQTYQFSIDQASTTNVITWDAGSGGIISQPYNFYSQTATLAVDVRARVYQIIHTGSNNWYVTSWRHT